MARSEERRVGKDCDWSSDVCSSDLRDMVAKNYLAHEEKGTETPHPIDRVRAAGLSPILVAENIATASGIQYESGRPVFPLRQWKREGLSYKENGQIGRASCRERL